MMSQIITLIIVRYAEFEAEGILTRSGVARVQTLMNTLDGSFFPPVQVFHLDFEGKPPDTPVSRTARVITASLGQDLHMIQPVLVRGETSDERAANVRVLVEFLHDGSPTVIVVVNYELSSSLAALYTKGWSQDCVSILDPGCAHVLQLERQAYQDH